MKKNLGAEFFPEIKVFPGEKDCLLVTFDSNCPWDIEREAVAVRVPFGFTSLRCIVKGFDAVESREKLGRLVSGQIVLQVTDENGKDTEIQLAKLAIQTDDPETGKPVFSSSHKGAEQVLIEVRQGTAQAMSDALNQHARRHAESTVSSHMTGRQTGVGPAGSSPGHYSFSEWGGQAAERPPVDDDKRFKRKMMGAMVAVASIAFLTVITVKSLEKPEPATIDGQISASVMEMFKQVPGSQEAQVQLTIETLKSMGLDPGSSGDIGCLAQ